MVYAPGDILDDCALKLQTWIDERSEVRLRVPVATRVAQANSVLFYGNISLLLLFFLLVPTAFMGMDAPAEEPASAKMATAATPSLELSMKLQAGSSSQTSPLLPPGPTKDDEAFLNDVMHTLPVEDQSAAVVSELAEQQSLDSGDSSSLPTKTATTPTKEEICRQKRDNPVRGSGIPMLLVAFVAGALLNVSAFLSVPCF